jgi:hypothetical protein
MISESSSYSAHVDMFLVLDDHKLPLGQLGPAHCILEQEREFPPGDAEIVLIIDGRESRMPVYLPNGISPGQTRVAYQALVTAK